MEKLTEKALTTVLDCCKENLNNLVSPTTTAIGNNLGEFFDGFFSPLGAWGQKRKQQSLAGVQKFKAQLEYEMSQIPQENYTEPPLRVIGPVLEASKFYMEEEYCRNMFAALMASACNSEKSAYMHPAFPSFIEQLTPLDAKFLLLFKTNTTYPAVELKEIHIDKRITPFVPIIIDFKENAEHWSIDEQLSLTKVVENLERLGLLLKNTAVLELGYDYNNFKKTDLYNACCSQIQDGSSIDLIKYRIELTQLGHAFMRCCVP